MLTGRKNQNSTAKNLKLGATKALDLFQRAAKDVPAYKDFLRVNDINPKTIKSISDFAKLPPVTKENYLRVYPSEQLAWKGDRFTNDIISVSSGSSGEPFFWPRGPKQHEESGIIYDRIYRHIFHADSKPTLLVVCFSMGNWVAGTYTTFGAMEAARGGLKLNIATPAIELIDALNTIERLAPLYEQVILAGYPPFIKDLIDAGIREGIDWEKWQVGFTVAGESISEELRDYFLEHGTSSNRPGDVVSIYGTADAGIVAHESPVSVAARRRINTAKLSESMFGRPVLPTLAHFDPMQRYFEEKDGALLFTSDSGLPLIRYSIKDAGGVISSFEEFPEDLIYEALHEVRQAGYDLEPWHSFPLVYVHGRTDFTATLYAVLIYPENIKQALFDQSLRKFVSGRFAMNTKATKSLDQYLEIHIELKEGFKEIDLMNEQALKVITETLKEVNAEYRKLSLAIGDRAVPKLVFHPKGSEPYFGRGNKQRWKAS